MSSDKHLIVMAAGTGGHVIPGLAVAQEMQARGWSVSWLGTTKGMENQLVPPCRHPAGHDRLQRPARQRAAAHDDRRLRCCSAFWQCLQIIRRRQAPAAVLGMGGYVCFPGGLMASLLGKPLLLVNADAALLLSNKALLPVADRIAFGFDGDAARRTRNAVVTGNPVRAEIEALPDAGRAFRRPQRAAALLVVGGSLGAKVLNETLPQALALIDAAARPQVTHQTGAAHMRRCAPPTQQRGVEAEVLPFIDDMAAAAGCCDVIVCRAGAVTVSELCAAGVAGVLVPLVVSTTSHQRDNAQWLAGHGAGIHLPQAELTPQRLGRAARRADARSAADDGRQGARAGQAACRSAGRRRARRIWWPA